MASFLNSIFKIKKMKKGIVITAIAGLFFSAPMQAQNKLIKSKANNIDLKIFPATMEGYERYVLQVPTKTGYSESNIKLELIPGKTKQVDCNKQNLNGDFEEKTVDGWGVNYYVFKSDGTGTSTMMGCPENSTKTAFVTGQSKTINYNSKVPVVVFVPKGFGLHYRYWTAGKTYISTKK